MKTLKRLEKGLIKEKIMSLFKFHETESCQCFVLHNPSKEIKELFNHHKFLFIFYNMDSYRYEFSDLITAIFYNQYDFFYMFSFNIIPMNRILPKQKNKLYTLPEYTTPTNKFSEIIKDDNVYLIPLSNSNKKISFQILDKQLIKINSHIKSSNEIIRKYNEDNEKHPIKIIDILKSLMNGFGISDSFSMIRFKDEYKENEYQPIHKNDIVFGYPYTSYLRTFIIKFLMGFIVGSLFRLLLKKPLRKEIYVSFLILLGLILYAYALYIFINSNVEYKNIIFIFSSILFALIIIITILIFKIKNVTRCLLLSLLASIFVNVIGEFFMRILFLKLAGQTYNAALISSFSKLPGALLTSIITILLVAILFYPLYKATYKINKLNDLNQYFKN